MNIKSNTLINKLELAALYLVAQLTYAGVKSMDGFVHVLDARGRWGVRIGDDSSLVCWISVRKCLAGVNENWLRRDSNGMKTEMFVHPYSRMLTWRSSNLFSQSGKNVLLICQINQLLVILVRICSVIVFVQICANIGRRGMMCQRPCFATISEEVTWKTGKDFMWSVHLVAEFEAAE